MKINFYKYQGTGNDFIIIDNRKSIFNQQNTYLVKQLCNRKFGVGADGLILIDSSEQFDFNMIYFNADGTKSFCGNGSRCAVTFAKYLGIIKTQTIFLSTDGEHEASINEDGEVSLKMHDIPIIEKGENYYYLNTGSPHYITEVNNLKKIDVLHEGRAIRYNNRFKTEGTNVNFVKYNTNNIDIRTYERGVEAETLSCGTGVTAAALSWADKFKINKGKVKVNAVGGELTVSFTRDKNGFHNIYLTGAATFVFKGKIQL